MAKLLLVLCLLAQRQGWEAHLNNLAAQFRQNPEDAQIAIRLAMGHAQHGEPDQALTWARTAQKLGAHPLRAKLAMGDAHFHVGQFQQAADYYLEVAKAAPHNGHAHLQLWKSVREIVAVSGRSGVPESVSGHFQVLRENGFYLPKALSRPTSQVEAETRTKLGEGALRAGKLDEAIGHFQDALRFDEAYLDALKGLGTAWARSGQDAQALGPYRIFLEFSERETRDVRDVRRIIYDAERRRALSQSTRTHETRPR